MNIFVDINETINLGDMSGGKDFNDVLVSNFDNLIFLKDKSLGKILKKSKNKDKLRFKLLESSDTTLKFDNKSIKIDKKKYKFFISKIKHKIIKNNNPFISKKYNYLTRSWFLLIKKYYSNNLIMLNTFGPESNKVIEVTKCVTKKLITSKSMYFMVNINNCYHDYKRGLVEFYKKVDKKYINNINLYQENNNFKINQVELTNYFNKLSKLHGLHSTRQSYNIWNINKNKLNYGKIIPIDGKKLTIFFDDHAEINKKDSYTNIQLLKNNRWKSISILKGSPIYYNKKIVGRCNKKYKVAVIKVNILHSSLDKYYFVDIINSIKKFF